MSYSFDVKGMTAIRSLAVGAFVSALGLSITSGAFGTFYTTLQPGMSCNYSGYGYGYGYDCTSTTSITGPGGGGGGGGGSSVGTSLGIPLPYPLVTPKPPVITPPVVTPPVVIPTTPHSATTLRPYWERFKGTQNPNIKENVNIPDNWVQSMMQTGTPAIKKGIFTIFSKSVDTTRPNWLHPVSTPTASENLADWLQYIPNQDRNANAYIVIPTTGIVAPIVGPRDDTVLTEKFMNRTASMKDVASYFLQGVFHHPGSAELGSMNGNTIIGGHSSWYYRDASTYRTIFTALPDVDAGEQVWIYAKDSTGTYILYKYAVYASYETKPNDRFALANTAEPEITLYTCTPIGGISGRWIVKGKLIVQ